MNKELSDKSEVIVHKDLFLIGLKSTIMLNIYVFSEITVFSITEGQLFQRNSGIKNPYK